MSAYLASMDESYGEDDPQRRVMTTTGIEIPGAASTTLPGLADWVSDMIKADQEVK